MKIHQTQSLTVGFKCCVITQALARANSPCVVTPFKGDTDPIAQGDGTDPGTRNTPLNSRDYLRNYSDSS
jgi:hypothetical protein